MYIIHANRISVYVFSVTDIYLALMKISNIWKQKNNSLFTNIKSIFLWKHTELIASSFC